MRDLRISLTDRCNFRCVYCMLREVFGTAAHFLPDEALLTGKEIVRLAQIFVRLGVRKIRLTGGEPWLRPDLEDLVGDLARIEGIEEIALTTNGATLNMAKALRLKAAGLTRVTVSLDSLDSRRFGRINGVNFPVERVLAAIQAATSAGLTPVKGNVVIKRGMNDEDIVPLADYFRFSGHVVRFIEFMGGGGHGDFGGRLGGRPARSGKKTNR